MRKLLLNFTVCLTVMSSAIPVTACTFNFYVDRSKDKIKQFLASETSNVVKSLVLGSQLNTDSKQTIDDMFGQQGPSNIVNQNRGQAINNWGDFVKLWGYNGHIINDGFDQDQLIVGTGKGTLTQQINSKKSLDNTLDLFKYSSSLNIITNSLVYNNVFSTSGAMHGTLVNYLKMFQSPDQLPDNIKAFWPLINNVINNYQSSVLTPITNLLTDLVSGWNDAPADLDGLKTYMESLKDGSQPFSQWVDDTGKWQLSSTVTNLGNWTTNDFDIYRGGVFLNYLFKKIGDESNGKLAGKYLGTIIDENLNDISKIWPTLKPYFSALLTSPAYIFMLVQAFLPLIKQTILQMPDVTKGVEHLTLGAGYPTNASLKSWNLLDIITTIKDILSDPKKVTNFVTNLIDSSFLYDVQIHADKAVIPLPVGLQLKKDAKAELIKTLTDLLSGASVTPVVDEIYELVKTLNDQYPTGGIDINLADLKALLIGNHGILLSFVTVATKLAVIIKTKHDPTEAELDDLYTSLGGVIPSKGQSVGDNFVPDSILDLLKKQFTQTTSPLLSIVSLLYNSDRKHRGIAQLLIDSNNQWIQKNYYDYFDASGKKSTFTNINFTESVVNNKDVINLNYFVSFNIKGKTYNFFIKGIAEDETATFRGTHTFSFTEIDLIH